MTEPTREQRIDAAMVRLDRDGMIAAFENDYGQKWTDPEWRTEVSIWAAAWRRGRAAMAAGKDASPDEWEKLRDPDVLHANLLRGIPAKLTEAHLRHLLGDASPLAGSIGGGMPLSDWQITDLYRNWHDTPGASYADLVRTVERAHGIGALPGPDSQQPYVALPRDGGTDKLGGQS